MRHLRITGIYDQNTVSLLKSLDVYNFTFDLRPTSMNFTQAYKVSEIIQNTYGVGDRYTLQFDTDKDFVINGVIEKLSPAIAREELILEFCSYRELEECESFKLPFVWQYDESNESKFLNSSYLHTVVFGQQLIQQLELNNRLYPFMNNFFQKCPAHINVELAMDWSSSILHTLIDFFPINGLVYSINNEVELQFRHVNLQLVQQHIELTKTSFDI